MPTDPDMSLSEFADLLTEKGFVEVGQSVDKVTYQASNGGRMELPRRMSGRVFRSHVERAARLLHTSTNTLLADAGVQADHPAGSPVITPAAAARLIHQAGPEPTQKPASTVEPAPASTASTRRRNDSGSHTAAVLSLLAQTGRVMDFTSIVRELADRGHPATRGQVRSACGSLAKDNKILRVSQGVYRIVAAAGSTHGSRLDLHVTTDPPAPHDNSRRQHQSLARGASACKDAKEAWDHCFGETTLPASGEMAADLAQWFEVTNRLLSALTPYDSRHHIEAAS